ncbi:hypothetical protein INT47_012553 [Mucor saturninus]|uniref:Uncharacterized protein n=1 Tax=Mucor saturninus TaxID=64648 RepID=A0A8H7R133_9FUNG|nr:hypothetical protein INT47_012553 [Mucor saturninus]
MSKDEDIVDGTTAEIAKKATPKKLFMDKLKSALGIKCHVNNFLFSVHFLPAKDIKNVVFPVVQMMGFDAHVYFLQLVNRGLYVSQDLDSFSFTTNYTSLKQGLRKVINGLACIEEIKHWPMVVEKMVKIGWMQQDMYLLHKCDTTFGIGIIMVRIELKTMYETYQVDNEDDMSRILSGTSNNKKTPISCRTTALIWNDKDNDDLEDSDSDGNNDT